MNTETNKRDNNPKHEAEPARKADQLADLQPLDEKAEEVKGGPGLLLPAVQKLRD
jgi:hypothetical protein